MLNDKISTKLRHASAFENSGSETCSMVKWYLGESDFEKSHNEVSQRVKNSSQESSESCCFLKQVKNYISETATHILIFFNLASHSK